MKFYQELAKWWPLISAPEDYADEAAFFLKQLEPVTSKPDATLLELGSGGGNNALHMKGAFAAVTLVDLSDGMLAVSRKLNPECEHLQGDMRTVRLNRTFDAVFIHDAIDYMLTELDLRQAIETAFVHCKSGGMVVFVPDYMQETFEPETDFGGEDGDGQAVRYLEWMYATDDKTYITDYVFIIRDGDTPVQIVHDQHRFGLFPLATWLSIIRESGFEAHAVIDEYERHVFIGHKA